MRALHGLLIVSIAFNCAAIVFLTRPMMTASDLEATEVGVSERPSSGASPQGSVVVSDSGDPEGLWDRLHSDDLQVMIDRMRAAGFPERELRVAVREVYDQREAVRRATLVRSREPWPYWRKVGNEEADREIKRELAQQMARERAVMNGLSRVEPGALEKLMDRISDPVGPVDHLPEEKREIFRRITRDYRELQGTLWALGGSSEPALDEKIRQLDVEYERELRAALTPKEYEEHHLKAGPTARALRGRLKYFLPTEEEYKVIHAAHESVRMSLLGAPKGEATERAREQALESLEARVEQGLGPDRFADYQQAMLPAAEKLNSLLMRFDRPLRTGREIEKTRQDILRRAEAVLADLSFPPAEKARRLEGLQAEARQRIRGALGGDRYLGDYEEMERWIGDLSLRAAP